MSGTRYRALTFAGFVAALAAGGIGMHENGRVLAQSGAATANWPTDGGTPQRTAWQKDEHILNVGNVKNLTLKWKYRTDNEPREMHAMFPPLIAGRVNTPGGPRQLALVAGSSDNVYAVDVASGTLLWKKHFESTF